MANNNQVNEYKGYKTEIFRIIFALLMLIAIGTIVYHYLENWSYIDSFYFAVISVTTVGYGDLFPTSDESKLFTSVYILIGVSVFFYGLFTIGEHFVKKRIAELEARIKTQNKNK